MKTFYFSFSSGHIGGDGVVVAKNKSEALLLANQAIADEPLNKSEPLQEKDLKEVSKNTCIIVNNGDY